MAAKKPKRRPFDVDAGASPELSHPSRFIPQIGPVFSFFDNRAVRETIESVIVAVVLAMVFRTFGAEAYIIPTGSMAPTLQGQHMDVHCDKCGSQYLTGSSGDNSTVPLNSQMHVTTTFCPFCRSPMTMNPRLNSEQVSNHGDRIVVNKFIYDFKSPNRFDVIVFKNPNNGKQNFIKRLVGLPEEKLIIENGDLFSMEQATGGTWTRQIVRKPPHKLKAMLQIVDDTDFIAPQLFAAKWPLRWNEWSTPSSPSWTQVTSDNKPFYSSKADQSDKSWLRYRHLLPSPLIWEDIKNGKTFEGLAETRKGELIGDYYCYNQRIEKDHRGMNSYARMNPGLHWVGDLAVQVDVQVKSNSGSLYLDLVEGGVHFEVKFDVATGQATLNNSAGLLFETVEGSNQVASATSTTPVKGPGNYDLLFANADNQIQLWVNGKLMTFDANCFTPNGRTNPFWSSTDPGDAEPAGVAATGLDATISRLRLWRDIYYGSVKGRSANGAEPENETGQAKGEIRRIMENPELWTTREGLLVLNQRFRDGGPMFELDKFQFLPMGDNSPESHDGRVWDGDHFVPGQLMIGRALFVYWPHVKSKPFPYCPNFERMGPIQ